MTYKEAIEKELELNFKISFEEASKRIEGLKQKTFNNVKSQWKKHNRDSSGINGKKPKTKNIPEKELNSPLTFIDDPNELLMSVAMRELNKSNPEVRWASILLQMLDKTKQLETKSKSEVKSKLKQYSSSELIELRKRLIES
jgi:hypothetical protein